MKRLFAVVVASVAAVGVGVGITVITTTITCFAVRPLTLIQIQNEVRLQKQ